MRKAGLIMWISGAALLVISFVIGFLSIIGGVHSVTEQAGQSRSTFVRTTTITVTAGQQFAVYYDTGHTSQDNCRLRGTSGDYPMKRQTSTVTTNGRVWRADGYYSAPATQTIRIVCGDSSPHYVGAPVKAWDIFATVGSMFLAAGLGALALGLVSAGLVLFFVGRSRSNSGRGGDSRLG